MPITLFVEGLPHAARRRNPSRTTLDLNVARITGFPYYVHMNITLSIDDDLVKEVRKIAVERDTTLTGLVRDYLKDLAAEHERTGRKRREREALERSFRQFRFRIGRKTWTREELHERF
jgi:hypothetical protein